MADIYECDQWPFTIGGYTWLWSLKLRSCPTRLPLIAVLVSGGDSTIIAINPSHSSLIASFVTITSDQTGQILAIAQTRRTTPCGGRLLVSLWSNLRGNKFTQHSVMVKFPKWMSKPFQMGFYWGWLDGTLVVWGSGLWRLRELVINCGSLRPPSLACPFFV